MVKVITIEREYGSQGGEFARRLADTLGWKLIDRCLVDEIAAKAGVTKSAVENCDERLDPWYHRLGKSFWYGSLEGWSVPQTDAVFDSESLAGLVRDYLKDVTAQGNCVIVGRGSACALASVSGVFNVFVYASLGRRVRWFEEHFPEHAADARRELDATDARRQMYIHRYYNCDWTDRRIYHLMINSCIGFDGMTRATLECAGLAVHSVAE